MKIKYYLILILLISYLLIINKNLILYLLKLYKIEKMLLIINLFHSIIIYVYIYINLIYYYYFYRMFNIY